MPAALRHNALLGVMLVIGCAPMVREDRTIHFAPDGKQVAFQHGRDGIYVVETEGEEPKKIFQPDADMIAVSSPLWSPIDKRLLFTTAKSADAQAKNKSRLPAEPEAGGNLYSAQQVEYTCWLRTEPKPGQPLNVPLFTVHCGHSGYVAANLAVRWHPDGQHILYIEQDNTDRHTLREYDLQTQTSRRVFPQTGRHLLFDWAPDKVHLVCVVGENGPEGGTWFGKPGTDDWWHVPKSSELGRRELEDLRTVRPVWSPDGTRFVFITLRPSQDGQSAAHTLHLAMPDAFSVTTLAEGDKPIRDLHWRPDSARLGFLRGQEIGDFHLVDPKERSDRVLGDTPFTNFIGWDHTGEQLAFVARQPLPHDPAKSWAFLLLPDVNARHRVLVAPSADPSQLKTVFSGLQVTFPQWSPSESNLSLWATFHPPYRSWLSHLLALGADEKNPLRGLTLQPGDPALVLDPATGQRSWKAINAREKTQVDHYHLLRREYAEAWKWYEQAAEQAINPTDRSAQQFVRRFVQGRDALFFQAYCLDKLGRHDEATKKRRQLEETFLPDLAAVVKAPAADQPAPFGAAEIKPTKEQLHHWRDLYVAEVFLSLDALEDGETYFRDGLKAATSDAERLSKAIVLTQFLLFHDRKQEYGELATDTVLPLLLRQWKPRTQPLAANQEANLILAYSDGLSLLPLFTPEFLAGLSEKQVRSLVSRWQKQAAGADDDVKRLGIDLFLEAAARRLGQKDQQQAAARRIAANPAHNVLLGDKGVAGLLDGIRKAPEAFALYHQFAAMIP